MHVVRRLAGRVVRAVAEESAERCQHVDERPLESQRRPGHVPLVAELVGEHSELKQTGIASPAYLPGPGQADERLDQVLRTKGRPELKEHVCRFVADGPEPVPRPGWDDGDIALSENLLAACDRDTEPAGEHLVPLLLTRVDVRCRHEPARTEDEFVLEQLAVRVRSGLAEDHALAGRRILEHLVCMRHGR